MPGCCREIWGFGLLPLPFYLGIHAADAAGPGAEPTAFGGLCLWMGESVGREEQGRILSKAVEENTLLYACTTKQEREDRNRREVRK